MQITNIKHVKYEQTLIGGRYHVIADIKENGRTWYSEDLYLTQKEYLKIADQNALLCLPE